MVRVELYQSRPGELTGFRAVGHAGYAPPGEDIVCAGVSAVTQACVLGLKDHLQLPVALKAEDGLLECRLPREIPEEKQAAAQAILETMVLALREIEKGHGRYFALISLDAPRTARGRGRGSRRSRKGEGGRKPSSAVQERRPDEAGAASGESKPAAEGAPRRAEGRRPRKGWTRRRSEERQHGLPEDEKAAERPPEAEPAGAEPAEASPRVEEPPATAEREPEHQVAVAQEPAPDPEKRSILNPFRRKRLRSFRPGRLGRRWRP